jgi:hypothetical protein
MEALVAALVVAGATLTSLVVRRGVRGKAKRHDQLVAAWTQAATTVGGHLEMSPAGAELGATVDGVAVTARATLPSSSLELSKSAPQATSISAPLLGPGPRFVLHREECFTAHKPIGVPLSLDAFRPAYGGRADDPGSAAAWIATVRDQLRDPYCFGMDDEIWAWRPGTEDDAARLVVEMRAIAALARAGDGVTAAWKRLAADLEGIAATSRPWPSFSLTAVYRGTPYAVETVTDFFTDTRVLVDQALGATVDFLGPAWRERIDRLGPRRVDIDGRQAAVILPGIVLDPARIRAVVELLAPFASPSTGPYR